MITKQFNSVLKISVITLVCLAVFSCNQGANSENFEMSKVDITDDYAAVEDREHKDFLFNQSEIKAPTDLKIIKSANVRYKVKSVKSSTQKIKQFSSMYSAYISDLRFENSLYSIENRFTIKVPKEYFDELLDSINGVVEFIEHENITTKDVSEEFVDLEARLKTKLEVKKRYETILRKNAKTVKDILATEEKLRIIQEEIESAQGRLKFLSNKVAYSTIQVDLYETVEYKEEPENYSKTFLAKTKEGFSFGWDIVQGLILGIIHIWPLVLLGLLVFLYLKKRIRK